MDILSDILKVVKLEGALFFNAEFSAPWCLHSRLTKEVAHHLSPAANHLILYHLLTEGRAYARLPDGRREELVAGDIVVLPHGDAHYLGNGWPEKPVDSFKTFSKNLTEGLRVARFGGGGEITRFVCGFMACEPRLSEVFLSGLPPLIKVHIGKEPSGQWIENSIRFSVGDTEGVSVEGLNAGSALVHAKLSEVLFVETLRRYISSLPADRIGWLAGARDPAIGQALAPGAQGSGASLDSFRSGARRRSFTYALERTLPTLPRRIADGLPGAVASEAGRRDPSDERRLCRPGCRSRRLYFRSFLQSRLQARVRLPARTVSAES